MMGDLKLNDAPAVKVVSFDMNGTITGGRFTDLVWSEGIPRLYSLRKKIPLEQAKKCVFEEYAKLGEGRRGNGMTSSTGSNYLIWERTGAGC